MLWTGCNINVTRGTPKNIVAAHAKDSLLCNTWSPKKKMTVVGHAASRPAAVVPAPPAHMAEFGPWKSDLRMKHHALPL